VVDDRWGVVNRWMGCGGMNDEEGDGVQNENGESKERKCW